MVGSHIGLIPNKIAQRQTKERHDVGPRRVIDNFHAVKTNIGDSLNVVVQIERRPGRRFISEVLEVKGYDPDADLFDFCAIYLAPRENP